MIWCVFGKCQADVFVHPNIVNDVLFQGAWSNSSEVSGESSDVLDEDGMGKAS